MTIMCSYGNILPLIFLFGIASSRKIHGQLYTHEYSRPAKDWAFLTRFCFLSTKGRFEFSMKYPAALGTQQILLYYDDIWSKGYSNNKNCSSRRSLLTYRLGQIIDLVPDGIHCRTVEEQDQDWIHCNSSRYFKTIRERWWFLVIANCGAKNLLLNYRLHLTNGDDFLHREFSADEFYIFPIIMAFFITHLIMCIISLWIALKLFSCQLFHTSFKLYMAALWIYTFHLLLIAIAQGKLGNTGIEDYYCEVAGHLMLAVSEVIFLLMLILIAKGYSITRGRIKLKSKILISSFMGLYILTYSIIFIWEAKFHDEANVLYRFESIPGYLLLGLQILMWFWFILCTMITSSRYPEKMKFYVPFAAFYTLWFFTGPVVMVISMSVMAKWTREKTVSGVTAFVSFLAYAVFMMLTWPKRVNKMFPFHVKTHQIGVMENAPHQDPGDEGFPEREQASSNFPYVGSTNENQDFTDIFTVSYARGDCDDRVSMSKTKNVNVTPTEEPKVIKPDGDINASSNPSSDCLELPKTVNNISCGDINESSSSSNDCENVPKIVNNITDSPPPSYNEVIKD